MTGRIITALFTCCILCIKASGQEKDTIVLYNGQILIGEVQFANFGAITIDDIDLKIVNIKMFKIKTLVIKERFKIETIDKKYYYGTMKSAGRVGWVEIQTVEGENIPLHITHIFQLISLETGFFKRLNGNVSAGLSFTKSSDIGQINFSANVQFATKSFDYSLSLSSIGSIDSGKYSRDNENIVFLTTYDLTTTWFLAVSGQYQRNLELSIARRYLFMAGAGNKLIIKKNWRLMASTGMTFSQEKSTADQNSSLLYEVPVIFQFNFYQFQHPDITISSSQSAYFSLSQKGRMRWDGSTSFSWQLIRFFYLNINPYTNYDSEPPGNGSKFDYGIVLGLSYKF
jgi:hypothetical protein